MEERKRGALVAMSGGVDSAVSALLMQREGFRCVGATMRLHDGASDAEAARDVAGRLGIEHRLLDLRGEFKRQVVENFVRSYWEGRTPNPCIDCNRRMKFGRLLEYAKEWGLEVAATGHYARIGWSEEAGRFLLKKAADPAKDQSYVLYTLTQEQLAHIRFPLGGLTKPAVRALAEQAGFANAHSGESQDICFVPDGDYAAFIERYTGAVCPPGDFISPEGRVLGRHRGAIRYTIGQRKGLGLALPAPGYVCDKDMRANTVTVGPQSALLAKGLRAVEANWILWPALAGPQRVTARTRYRQPEQPATVTPCEGGFTLLFDKPQRAIAPGQAVVLYQGEVVVGGGTIAEAIR